MKCSDCSYYWRQHEWDEETQEMVPVEAHASCHFNHEEMFGIPAPCEESDRWEVESSRDDWDSDEDYSWQQI